MVECSHIAERIKALVRQFVQFGLIGVLNTVLFYVLYLLFLFVAKPAPAYLVAYVLSMAFAIVMNLKFTFKLRVTAGMMTAFLSIYLVSMLVGVWILGLLIGVVISPQLAGLCTVAITVVINFLGLKLAARWGA